jgi:hypothetical protein
MTIVSLVEASSMKTQATTSLAVTKRWSNKTTTFITTKLQIAALMKTQRTNTTGIISPTEAVQIQGSKTHKGKQKIYTAKTLQGETTLEETTLLDQRLLTREEPIQNQKIKTGYLIRAIRRGPSHLVNCRSNTYLLCLFRRRTT